MDNRQARCALSLSGKQNQIQNGQQPSIETAPEENEQRLAGSTSVQISQETEVTRLRGKHRKGGDIPV